MEFVGLIFNEQSDQCTQFIASTKCAVLSNIYIYMYKNIKDVTPTCFATSVIFQGAQYARSRTKQF